MAHYVLLLKFTDQGVRNIKDTTKRAAAASDMAAKMGAKITNVLWTLGQYDLVLTADARDDETIAAVSVKLGSLGNVSIQTLPSEPSFTETAAMVSSSGASAVSTRSYWPSVQRTLVIFAPILAAMSLAAAARLVVSLMLRTPWSVNFNSKT